MSSGKSGPPSAGPRLLQQELADLRVRVEAQQGDEENFRKANAGFIPKDETTRLLLAACEKLALEKEAVDQSNFEEHTSSLPYLCRHFGTSIGNGLSERLRHDRAAIAFAIPRRRAALWFAFCCRSEFPPSQAWWMETSKLFAPAYEVLRDKGRLETVSQCQLGPGEIFYLRAGQRSPLDARILVHTKGAAVDLQQLAGDSCEVRQSTSEATALHVSDSGNIVLKDSVLLRGELFCMAVRSRFNALVPSCSSEGDGARDQELTINQELPLQLSLRKCRSIFQRLCTKAQLVCRSFEAIARLAHVKSLVVLLSRDLFSKASIEALVSTCKRLGRALVLVDCDCGADLLAHRCKELGLEYSEPPTDTAANTALTSPGGSYTMSPTNSDRLQGTRLPGQSALPEAERSRLHALADQLSSQRDRCFVLGGVSRAGLQLLCCVLADHGMPPLYAAANFFYPEVYMRLTSASVASPHRSCGDQQALHMERFSEESGAYARSPGGKYFGRADTHGSCSPSEASVPRWPSLVPSVGGHGNCSQASMASGLASMDSSQVRSPTSVAADAGALDSSQRALSADAGSTAPSVEVVPPPDSAKAMNLGTIGAETPPPRPARGSVALLVGVGAFGVLAERSDAVLVRPDLACLAQALELATKAVPPAGGGEPAKASA